ncbi:MAG: PhnD/SsuA/transferrin family substrate-binding protein [Gammaproteobacteria bacterium]|nr:PhnD/SsuA/transferrin family substrate-binding protein [Gammaproteobacteria bacterium]
MNLIGLTAQRMKYWSILLILSSLFTISNSFSENNKEINIGVLSHRGYEITKNNWSSVADYLSDSLDAYHFTIIPLNFSEIEAAVKHSKIDFLLANSGIYVNMEVRHQISRIVTLNNRIDDIPLNIFSGVIFARKDRQDIVDIKSLSGKHFLAVDKSSLGGFQMAWREIKKEGLNPDRDFLSLSFAGTHDEVVMAIKKGHSDVGTVRTGILETMAQKGDIRLDEFRIIAPINNDGFPFLHSTSLYPEWPFSKLKHTSNELAQLVALALLKMNSLSHTDHNYISWTVPLSYQPVHELFKELNLVPYERYGRFTLVDAIKQYWQGITAILLFILIMGIMSTWIIRLNTKLKKSKISLEYRHDLILNSVCDGIYGVDTMGNCIFMNRSMKRNTGWEIDDFQSNNQHDLLHHTHEDGSKHELEECPVYLTFKDKQPRYIDDDIFWKKDGQSFPVEYSSTPMIDHKGDIMGSVVVYRDISERKLADEEKRRHQTEIAHIARLNTMGEMASGIAHELNQPLTAIATNSFACIQMLEAGDMKKERLIDILDIIGSQAQHSGEIIKQLRQFIRKDPLERSIINVNELINDTLLFVKAEIRKSTIKVIRNLDKNIPKVLVQPTQIEQVLLNLLKNAIEALHLIEKQTKILTITTEVAGDNAVIVSVADNGTGIDNTIKEGLFDPFITSKESGLGLGLSISQGIIEAHQGNLYLHSSSEQGTVFRFALPIISQLNDIDNNVAAKNLVN